MKSLRVLKFIGFGILGLGFIFLAVFVTMSLWNWLIPALFHGPVISFWQTAGLFILSKILLTGVAPGGHSRRYKKDWRQQYHAKYSKCCQEDEREPVTEEEK